MNVTFDLSEQSAAALEAQAREAHMSPELYLNKIVEQALRNGQPAGQQPKPKKSAYSLLAQYGPGPIEKEIDDNRREMFSSFGEFNP